MLSRKKLVGISLVLCLGFTAAMAVKSMFFSSRREVTVKTSAQRSGDENFGGSEFPEFQEPVSEPQTASPEKDSPARLNINSASAEELETLPGIGPVLAEEIVDYREKNGYFESVEEIINVSGIGKAKFKAISEDITVGER